MLLFVFVGELLSERRKKERERKTERELPEAKHVRVTSSRDNGLSSVFALRVCTCVT